MWSQCPQTSTTLSERPLVEQRGLTLVPIRVYFNERGLAKIRIGLCRGKKLHDKRQDLKKKDADREMRRGR